VTILWNGEPLCEKSPVAKRPTDREGIVPTSGCTVRKKWRERQRQRQRQREREREVPQLLLNLTNALVTFLSCPPRDWKKNIRIASQNSNDPMKREEAG
jgi:hypothetical protein